MGQKPAVTFKLSSPLPSTLLGFYVALLSLQTANRAPESASQAEGEGSCPLPYSELM